MEAQMVRWGLRDESLSLPGSHLLVCLRLPWKHSSPTSHFFSPFVFPLPVVGLFLHLPSLHCHVCSQPKGGYKTFPLKSCSIQSSSFPQYVHTVLYQNKTTVFSTFISTVLLLFIGGFPVYGIYIYIFPTHIQCGVHFSLPLPPPLSPPLSHISPCPTFPVSPSHFFLCSHRLPFSYTSRCLSLSLNASSLSPSLRLFLSLPLTLPSFSSSSLSLSSCSSHTRYRLCCLPSDHKVTIKQSWTRTVLA